jgi:mono/diheme cytochrome c family protein
VKGIPHFSNKARFFTCKFTVIYIAMAVQLNSLSWFFTLSILGMLVYTCTPMNSLLVNETCTGNTRTYENAKSDDRAHVKNILYRSGHRDTTRPTSPELAGNTSMYGSKLAQMPEADRKLVLQGRKIFSQICSTCHGPEGKGLTAMGAPPLVNSKRVNGESSILVKILLDGLIGPIDGKTYPDYMPPLGSANDDEWIASVLSYIRSDFGNLPSPIVKVEEVSKIRAQSPGRASMWTLDELLKAKN